MPPILYLTRLPRLVNLGQVELVGPVDQALGRLIIADLVGRVGCRVQLFYCARLRLGSGSGWAAGSPAADLRVTWRRRGGLLSSNYSARGSGSGSGWAPAPGIAAGGSRLPLPPTQL